MKKSFELIVSFAFALVFGLGLGVSGMLNPKNVIGFLDIGGNWQPALAFVMGSAILVAVPLFGWGKQRKNNSATPLFGEKFDNPPNKPDFNLVFGAAIFGIGWGISGICPGPALVLIGIAPLKIMPFIGAMILGLWLGDLFLKKQPLIWRAKSA